MDPLETFFKKSLKAEKKWESHSAEKSGKGTILLWNGFVFQEALDAFRIKY